MPSNLPGTPGADQGNKITIDRRAIIAFVAFDALLFAGLVYWFVLK